MSRWCLAEGIFVCFGGGLGADCACAGSENGSEYDLWRVLFRAGCFAGLPDCILDIADFPTLDRPIFIRPSPPHPRMGLVRWSRTDVAARILAGDALVVYRDLLLRVPHAWLAAHPGGALAILHFVGRDAADEIDAYHAEHTLRTVRRYAVGTVDTPWQPLLPPIMSGWVRTLSPDGTLVWHNEAQPIPSPAGLSSEILLVHEDSPLLHTNGPSPAALEPPPSTLSPKEQARHSAAYKALHKRIIDAGLYKTRYLTGYGPEVVRYLLLAAASAYAYKHGWLIPSAVCLGLLWHQLVFTVHDLGHMGVTHDWTIDRLLAIFLADFIGGLSVGWWVDVSPCFTPTSPVDTSPLCLLQNHNVHHRKFSVAIAFLAQQPWLVSCHKPSLPVGFVPQTFCPALIISQRPRYRASPIPGNLDGLFQVSVVFLLQTHHAL